MTDPLKEAFAKVKEDIFNLKAQLDSISRELHSIKNTLSSSTNLQSDSQTDTSTHNPSINYQTSAFRQTQNPQNQAIQHINETESNTPAHSSTDNLPFKAPKSQNTYISTGNGGVSTDRQTDRQTDTSTRNQGVKVRLIDETPSKTNLQQLINSLDIIKTNLHKKITLMTKQEFIVYAAIYQLELEGFSVDYSLLAQKLSLTESSIRDYVQRIIKKSVPLNKIKENNKKIFLSIPQEMKKILTLESLSELYTQRNRPYKNQEKLSL